MRIIGGGGRGECDRVAEGDADACWRQFSSIDFSIVPAIVLRQPTAESVLTTINDGDVFVIGGLVDHKDKPGCSYARANAANIKTARLPLSSAIVINNPRNMQNHRTERVDVSTLAVVPTPPRFLPDFKRRLGNSHLQHPRLSLLTPPQVHPLEAPLRFSKLVATASRIDSALASPSLPSTSTPHQKQT